MSLLNMSVTPKEKILSNMKSWLAETLGDYAEMMLPELGVMFIEDTPGLILEMHQAIDTKNAKQLKEAAHTLKGSSASMGLQDFARLCQEVEYCGKTDDIAGAIEKMPKLKAEHDQILSLFKEII